MVIYDERFSEEKYTRKISHRQKDNIYDFMVTKYPRRLKVVLLLQKKEMKKLIDEENIFV